MTPEELDAAIPLGWEKVAALLAGASEKERRAAAPVALRWYKERKDRPVTGLSEGLKYAQTLTSLVSAVLGTATLSEIQKANCRASHNVDAMFAVLSDRRPDWLSDWVVWVLENNRWMWPISRRLVREGLVPRPDSPAYALALISGANRSKPVLDFLREDPALFEEAWELFRVEGGGEQSLAAYDKYVPDAKGWNHAFCHGPFERGRLLDASLEALARDFEQFRAGWFSRLHEDLRPTLEERAARSRAYLDLLSSRIRPTVSFALKALSLVQKGGCLAPEELMGAVGPALAAHEKGTVQAALKLLSTAVAKREDLRPQAWPLVLDALLHESPAVQADALAFLRKSDSPEVRAAVASRAADLAATLQGEIEAWIGPVEAAPLVLDTLEVAEPWRSLVEFDAVRAAYLVGSEPAPLRPAAHLGEPVRPVADGAELAALLATLLENPENPLDIERALEGVARLQDARPDARLTAPLLKRARKKFNGHFVFWGSLVEALAALALAWLTGSVDEPLGKVSKEFFASRIEEVALGRAWRVLALPTHGPAWIDPCVLAQRVLSCPEPAELDFVAALLRLAPHGREQALASLQGQDGEAARALRSALGEDGLSGPTASWWTAARDARYAWQPWDEWGEPLREQVQGYSRRLRIGVDREPAALEFPSLQVRIETGGHTAQERRWFATLWPACPSPLWMAGVNHIYYGLDYANAHWQEHGLEVLRDPDLPMTRPGRLLLAIALCGKEAGQQTSGVDILAAATEDGRINGRLLGAGMAELAIGGWARPARWAKTLGEVARFSTLHAWTVFEALQVLLAECEVPAVLELFVELGARLQRGANEAARARLALFPGGGKAGKLAKAALAQSGDGTAILPEVIHQAERGRAARAERLAGT